MKATNLGAVERERERESYTLKTISGACLSNLTYICNLEKTNKKYKSKDNVMLLCGYYDTG